MIMRIWKHIRKYWFYIVCSLIFAALSVASQLYVPILTGNAIDHMIGVGKVDFAGVAAIVRVIVAATAVTAISQWIFGICNNKITYNVSRDLRNAAIAKIQRLPVSYLDAHPTGDLVSRVIADVEQFADGLLMGFTQFFTGVLTILGTLGFMLYVNVPITLVVVCVTPLSFIVAGFIAKKTYRNFHMQTEVRGEQTAFINEMIEGQKVVQAFCHEKENVDQFDEMNERLQKASLKAIFFSSITNPATRFVNNVVYAGVALVGALFAVSGGISVGQLSCFLSYANQYTKPFNEISGVVTELQNAMACASRIFELLDEEERTPDKADARVLTEEQVDGTVEISDVSFSYVPDRKLIEHFNLSVKPGERVAIVGPTGCGKTTTGRTIIRLYDPTWGTVKFNGIEISGKMDRELHKYITDHIAMIFQDPIASLNPRMTVQEIIAEGLKIRGVKDPEELQKRVIAMLEHVGLQAEHASRYPHEFSGGQRQRIGIARALIVEPQLVIADEPVSALDVSVQAQVINLLNKLKQEMGLTILFIAHNLSVVKYFSDRIGVMYFGKLVEMADSNELFKNPLHPYTKALLSAIPEPDPLNEKKRVKIHYDPEIHHYGEGKQPSYHEVSPGHTIYCSDEEFEEYKKEWKA